VIPALQQHGYRCLAPQLDFCGTAEPVDSLASSINQVQRLIADETLQGNNVVLINHSFGGSVGCSSIKGFSEKDSSRLTRDSGKVVGIIQLCAFTAPSNTALYDMIDVDKSFHHSDSHGWEIIDGGDPEEIFYNDLTPEDAGIWKSRLLKHSSATVKDRANVYAGWADVPLSYVFCTKDGAIPIQAQEAMVAAARETGAFVTTKTLEAGHSPFLSKPEETVGVFLEILEDVIGVQHAET
jgi:pimeloyl-ACP methyl ester carboxylesterase